MGNPELNDQIRSFLQSRDCHLPHIALLQPADPFLDMAGESLRARIFLTENERGETLCLRPEFTIPVCRDHVAGGAKLPRRYAYLGEVFRQRREGGSEFFQAGIEDLGDPDIAGADARSLADALALVTAIAPAARWQVTIGDQSVFEAVVGALGLPRGWRLKLSRAFGAPGQVEALLGALGRPRRTERNLPPAVADALDGGDAMALSAAIAGEMERTGLAGSGRSAGEIAGRLIEQSVLDRARLSPDEIALLREFLAIRVPLTQAADTLAAFAGRLDGGMDLAAFEARTQRLAALGVDIGAVTYNAAFGRPLDYYTGLVFEIGAAGVEGPVVGGGRFDRLLALLGAEMPVPAVGFSVWLDRLEQARGGAK